MDADALPRWEVKEDDVAAVMLKMGCYSCALKFLDKVCPDVVGDCAHGCD
jgi:hypothetical protein